MSPSDCGPRLGRPTLLRIPAHDGLRTRHVPPRRKPMSTNPTTPPTPVSELATGTWRLDPSRSSVEFHVRHFYGLMTVKGHFDRYEGTVALGAEPAVQLTIDADSLDTKNAKRDA